MAKYHVDPSVVDIADELNPALDAIAALTPEQAFLLDQGASLATTLIDDAMQETMDALVALYTPFCGEALAEATVSSLFQPFVERAEARIGGIAAAVEHAISGPRSTDSILEGLLSVLVGEEAVKEYREESKAEREESFTEWFNTFFDTSGPKGAA